MQITVKQAIETLMRNASKSAEFEAAAKAILQEDHDRCVAHNFPVKSVEITGLIMGKVAHQISFAAQDALEAHEAAHAVPA